MVQKALQISSGRKFMEIIDVIKKVTKNLRYTNYGKKIYESLMNNYGEYLSNQNSHKNSAKTLKKNTKKNNPLNDTISNKNTNVSNNQKNLAGYNSISIDMSKKLNEKIDNINSSSSFTNNVNNKNYTDLNKSFSTSRQSIN